MNHLPFNRQAPLYVARPWGEHKPGDLFVPADHNVSLQHAEHMYELYWLSHQRIGFADAHDIVVTTNGFGLRTNGQLTHDGLSLEQASSVYHSVTGTHYTGEYTDIRTVVEEPPATSVENAAVEDGSILEQPAMAGDEFEQAVQQAMAEVDLELEPQQPEEVEPNLLTQLTQPEQPSSRRGRNRGNV